VELRHLEHFVAVAEERNFTRAARRLHLVQSALSVSIRSLERELDTQLFERTTREVRLTDAGRVLLPEARRTLDAAAGAQAIHRNLIRSAISAPAPPTSSRGRRDSRRIWQRQHSRRRVRARFGARTPRSRPWAISFVSRDNPAKVTANKWE